MIRVYMESEKHCEIVAIFEDEELYKTCLPAIEKKAIDSGMKLTESVEDEYDLSDLSDSLSGSRS